MSNINNICISGRLTADPDFKKTAGDVSLVSFSIACERNYKGSDGEKIVDFFRVVAWRGTADFVSNYVKKGYMVFISGYIQPNEFEDKEGNKHKNVDIVASQIQPIFPPKSDGQSGESSHSASSQPSPKNDSDTSSQGSDLPWGDDDLPF